MKKLLVLACVAGGMLAGMNAASADMCSSDASYRNRNYSQNGSCDPGTSGLGGWAPTDFGGGNRESPMELPEAVTWTLQSVTLQDGGTITGSFIYDANTNTYSAINITTTGLYLSAFDNSDLKASTVSGLVLENGTFVLQLNAVSAFTNAGGTILINTAGLSSYEGECSNATCKTVLNKISVTSGDFNAPYSVPEPASLALLGSALAGLFGFTALPRRRKITTA
ncbi:MAG TPA: PEP-CTERM sorting domain-containing protein [Rhizomicrobium sp.]|jgi:hypothetical protein|nr:PEP-CTERM sorting domain-containing protein [Rhizomicrobium sp.]